MPNLELIKEPLEVGHNYATCRIIIRADADLTFINQRMQELAAELMKNAHEGKCKHADGTPLYPDETGEIRISMSMWPNRVQEYKKSADGRSVIAR